MLNLENADLVLVNGKVVTVDRNDSIAEAVAVKNGKIMKVGTSQDVRALTGEKTKVIDLEGKAVLPGLIDCHIHVDWYSATTKLFLNIRGSANTPLEKILEKIRKKVQETPKGEWIIAQGRIAMQPYPTKEELDELAPDNPVIINMSSHRLLLNAKALEAAEGGKITKDRPTEEELHKLAPGGRIERDPKTGEPTGITEDCLDYIFRSCPYPYEKLKKAIKETCHELVSYGVTSIHELYSWSDSTRIYQDFVQNGELPLRMQLVPCVWGLWKSVDLDCILQLGLQTGFGNEWLKFGSIKIYVDARRPPQSTNLRLTQEKLNDLVIKAHEAGIRVIMHAVTREGTKAAITSVETALKERPNKDHRHRIEHFGSHTLIDLKDIEKVERLGIIPCPQPYVVYYGEFILTDRGPSYLFAGTPRDMEDIGQSYLGPFLFGYFIHRGLKVPGTSDATGWNKAINPWWSIWCAVNRKNYKGELVFPEEKIKVMEGIRAYTINSAYVGFEDDIKGSIEGGKLADMIVLSEDPLTIPEDRIKDIKVEITILNGKIVYNRR